jgi:hypothetical protein
MKPMHDAPTHAMNASSSWMPALASDGHGDCFPVEAMDSRRRAMSFNAIDHMRSSAARAMGLEADEIGALESAHGDW